MQSHNKSDLLIMLQDYDIITPPDAIDALCDETITPNPDTISALITVCDKLSFRHKITTILQSNTLPTNVTTTQIINHNLDTDQVISAYANGYTATFNGIVVPTTNNVTKLFSSDLCITKLYTNVVIHHRYDQINYSLGIDHYFASRLDITHTRITISELNANYNPYITSCHPFAHSLRILSAKSDIWFVSHQDRDKPHTCGINDSGLELCTELQELYADNNKSITTCEPFAATLYKLSAVGKCGIDDYGLECCTSIRELCADSNQKITTCDSFAQSLTHLSAKNTCGISDDGMTLCTTICELIIDDNDRVTTLDNFAHTLRKLSIAGNTSISDAALVPCTSIRDLNIDHNNAISSCAPFAHTLRKLSASGSECIMGDNGIAQCTNIEYLNVSHNQQITTCNHFATTLRHLIATNQCGISDSSITKCTNINILIADDNSTITTCAPFSKSLRKLSATRSCGITTRTLTLCKFIEELHISENENTANINISNFAATLKILSPYQYIDRDMIEHHQHNAHKFTKLTQINDKNMTFQQYCEYYNNR